MSHTQAALCRRILRAGPLPKSWLWLSGARPTAPFWQRQAPQFLHGHRRSAFLRRCLPWASLVPWASSASWLPCSVSCRVGVPCRAPSESSALASGGKTTATPRGLARSVRASIGHGTFGYADLETIRESVASVHNQKVAGSKPAPATIRKPRHKRGFSFVETLRSLSPARLRDMPELLEHEDGGRQLLKN